MKKFLSLVLALVLTMSLVVVPANATVTGVTLDKTSIELDRGEKETLTATVTANGGEEETVTWESSAETVAKVDENGEVTAVAAGTATITATSTAANTQFATCEVTVKDKYEITWRRRIKRRHGLPCCIYGRGCVGFYSDHNTGSI